MPDTTHNVLSNSSSGASPENLEESMKHLKIEDEGRHEGASGGPSLYPDRPGKPDCSFYMKTGLCTYGSSCKYNHPPITGQGNEQRDQLPQRDDQPDCQFFLKTGTCKFGSNCKYHHPRDKHDAKLQLNIWGLPIRKDERSCPYYMRTGSCKFGVACKFNHPQPVNIETMFPLSGPSVYGYSGSSAPTATPYSIGGLSSWHLARASSMSSTHRMPGFSAYMPFILPPTQATMPVQQGWNTYVQHAQPGTSVAVTFPERPDQPECQYYMKTGSCKYGSSCKYHHPKERNQVTSCTMGPFGLPLRPGEPACTFYAMYGSCKFGAACKFDHPVLAVFPYQETQLAFPYQTASGFARTTPKDSASGIVKPLDELMKSGRISGRGVTDKNPSRQTSPSNTAAHSESSGNQSD